MVVAAVFGEDSDKGDFLLDEDETNEYIHHNLSLPSHLWWNCCIDAPTTCAPTPFHAFIDHSSTPVLILSEFTDVMCLPQCKLFKPFSVSGAFVEREKTSYSITVLDEYCKIHLQSPDSTWKSHMVNAIICPNLHTNLILGLDFLAKNKIVVDAELHMAITKESNYDLLNPPCITLHKPVPSPHQCQKAEAQSIKSSQEEMRKLQCLVHCELLSVFEENPIRFDLEAHTTESLDLIASIQTHIKQLAGQKILQSLNTQYKKSFHDHFPNDIPHTRDLPTDVYHHIEIKPGWPISVGHVYSCPCKY